MSWLNIGLLFSRVSKDMTILHSILAFFVCYYYKKNGTFGNESEKKRKSEILNLRGFFFCLTIKAGGSLLSSNDFDLPSLATTNLFRSLNGNRIIIGCVRRSCCISHFGQGPLSKKKTEVKKCEAVRLAGNMASPSLALIGFS